MQASPAIKQGRAQAPASLNGLLHSGSLGSSAAGSASFFMDSSGTACLRLLLLTGLEYPLDQQGAFPGPSGPDQVMVHSVGMPFRKGLGHERFPPVLLPFAPFPVLLGQHHQMPAVLPGVQDDGTLQSPSGSVHVHAAVLPASQSGHPPRTRLPPSPPATWLPPWRREERPSPAAAAPEKHSPIRTSAAARKVSVYNPQPEECSRNSIRTGGRQQAKA